MGQRNRLVDVWLRTPARPSPVLFIQKISLPLRKECESAIFRKEVHKIHSIMATRRVIHKDPHNKPKTNRSKASLVVEPEPARNRPPHPLPLPSCPNFKRPCARPTVAALATLAQRHRPNYASTRARSAALRALQQRELLRDVQRVHRAALAVEQIVLRREVNELARVAPACARARALVRRRLRAQAVAPPVPRGEVVRGVRAAMPVRRVGVGVRERGVGAGLGAHAADE